MIDIPVIRWGKPYESLEKADVVHFETGEVMAQVGETIEMGGGEVPFSRELKESLGHPIPEVCGQPQSIWLMGELLPKE